MGYGDFHFIDWQPAEVTQTCLMSQEDRLTKCKTFLDAPGAGVNTLFTPSGMLLIERRAKSASGTASRLPATFAGRAMAPGTPPPHQLAGSEPPGAAREPPKPPNGCIPAHAICTATGMWPVLGPDARFDI